MNRRSAGLSHLIVVSLTFVVFAACNGGSSHFGGTPDAGDAGTDIGFDMSSIDASHDMGRHQIGDPCMGPTQCVDGALCIGTTSGDFRCMAACDTVYDLCDDGSVCLPVANGDAAICYTGGTVPEQSQCSNNLDCGPGLLCVGGTNTQLYCRQACSPTGGMCGEGQYCETLATGSGLCRDAVGAGCADQACPAGLTCSTNDADLDPHFPGGYCTRDCTSDSDCPGTAVCRTLPGTSRSICFATCDHVSDCRFNGSYDCYDSTVCDQSTDQTACQALFGGDGLCVHDF